MKKIIIQSLILIFATITSIYGYFIAWSYFWLYLKNSTPCGMERIVWILIIPEVLIFSFLLKLTLVKYFAYPRIFWVYPLIVGVLISLFSFDMGWGQGLMAGLFIICELIIAIYSFKNRTKSLE